MNVRTMRNIDRLLGVPICWIVAGVLRLVPTKNVELHSGRAMNILVMKFFGLGSIILSTSALSMLRSRFPLARMSTV